MQANAKGLSVLSYKAADIYSFSKLKSKYLKMKKGNYMVINFYTNKLITLFLLLAVSGYKMNAQCSLVQCIPQVNFYLPETCVGELNVEDLITDYDPLCSYEVSIIRNGMPTAPIVDAYDRGQTLGFTVTVNSSNTCSGTVTILDTFPPNPVCRTTTTVPLNNQGFASIPALAFDHGSYDNCGHVWFKVRRMTANGCEPNPQFNDQISFCCADIPENNIMVILRVYDVDPGSGVVDPGAFPGRYNECMVEVQVQDKLPPTVDCPLDITVDCTADLDYYLDEEIPGYVDNCGANMDIDVSLDLSNLNNCNLGYAIRTIIYSDMSNEITCVQNIYVENLIYEGGVEVQCPLNYMMSACGGDTHPDSLPAENGRPIITASPCSSIGVLWEDDVFTIVDDACFKILRTWKILNWCEYDPSTQEGIQYCYQMIKVLDDEAPEITGLVDLTFEVPILDENCSMVSSYLDLPEIGGIDCTPEDELRIRYRIDYGNNGSYDTPFILGNNASGNYPVGTHRIDFVVDDLCGNIANGSMLVTLNIDDQKKPTPVYKDLHTALMQGVNPPMVTVKASLFDAGSFDNCTSPPNLTFSYSNDINDTVRIFTCEDLDTAFVQIYVWDEAGNYDFANVYISILDNAGECPDSLISGGVISGLIISEDFEEIESVAVQLLNSNKQPAITNADGQYKFDRVQLNRFYTLEGAKNSDPRNGVSTVDILLIQRHILGLAHLNSPYKILAADANQSGSVTAADIREIQKLLLGKNSIIASDNSWLFIDSEFTFPDETDPFMTPFPQRIEINGLQGDIVKNFVGVKIGDVNNTASMNSLQRIAGRSKGEELTLNIEDQHFDAGQYLFVPVKATQFTDVHGFQATWQFDPEVLSFVGIEGGFISDFGVENYNLVNESKGYVAFNWFNTNGLTLNNEEPVLNLRFIARKSARLSEAISLNDAWLRNEAYHKGTLDGVLDLSFSGKQASDYKNKLFQNKPNPFSAETLIEFDLMQAGSAILTVSDLSGKVVWQQQGPFNKGPNQIILTKNQLGNPGIYIYRLDTGDFTDIKRLVLVN